MPTSRSSPAEANEYSDQRTTRRRSVGNIGRTQDVSYSEIQRIRQREISSMQDPQSSQDLVPVRKSRTQDDTSYWKEIDERSSRQDGRSRRYADENSDESRRSRRRESAPGYGSRRRTRNYSGSQPNKQQMVPNQQKQQQRDYRAQQHQQQQSEAQENREDDSDGCFFKRRFDGGSDGIITAVAGAALGAITARHFGGPKDFSQEAETRQGKMSKNWKMIGGAVVGAAAFNLAENGIKNYFEEQEERREDMETGMEFMGEMVGGFAPDVL